MCLVERPTVKRAYHKGKLSDASGVVITSCGYAFYVDAKVCGWRKRCACWKTAVSWIGHVQASLHGAELPGHIAIMHETDYSCFGRN